MWKHHGGAAAHRGHREGLLLRLSCGPPLWHEHQQLTAEDPVTKQPPYARHPGGSLPFPSTISTPLGHLNTRTTKAGAIHASIIEESSGVRQWFSAEPMQAHSWGASVPVHNIPTITATHASVRHARVVATEVNATGLSFELLPLDLMWGAKCCVGSKDSALKWRHSCRKVPPLKI